ncbi:late embryogenesis abundant protein At1g64065-like [Rhodamnia argentea]|uniref:Late embryogenesis abundant protein At1g64065-like n=1 Tax=Rhodamnia argentea TaxID=178133 RepID=A0A8B8PTP7_9MYRT|nr:late embryogenesis abundant protein At1g64065-like [Rhodamnia argentea]
MAEKNQSQYQPPESIGYHRSDQESLHTMEDEEAKRKKRMKWTIGIVAFIIFQVVQALFFVLVIMKFKSPKFGVAEFDVQSLTVGTQASPSFNTSFVTPIRIKNTNWGPFKYDASTVNFTYGGVQVGQAIIPKSKANFKSTKKINVNVTLSSANLPNDSNLGSDLSSGVITLNSQGELKGKVTVMFMFKKRKTSQMNCTMAINTATKAVQSLSCK